jgi:cell division protein FtsI (penicillin-binding protein 3)
LGINKERVPLEELEVVDGKMPNVIGMGARDAVYQLERQGVKVKLHGMGYVARQDIAPGTAIHTGMVCTLELK